MMRECSRTAFAPRKHPRKNETEREIKYRVIGETKPVQWGAAYITRATYRKPKESASFAWATHKELPATTTEPTQTHFSRCAARLYCPFNHPPPFATRTHTRARCCPFLPDAHVSPRSPSFVLPRNDAFFDDSRRSQQRDRESCSRSCCPNVFPRDLVEGHQPMRPSTTT